MKRTRNNATEPTGVVEKRRGKWVIVQTHFSFAADKTAAQANTAPTASHEEFSDYRTMRQHAVTLIEQHKYAAASAVLKRGLEQFPDHVHANTFNLALANLMQKELEKAVYWLEEGHHRGVFYGKWAFHGELWEPLASNPRFKRLLQTNNTRIAAAQSKAALKLDVVTPTAYNPKRKYPLFIALHGGGENLGEFKPRWTSPRLRSDYITAYVQSSQVASMTGFHWQDEKTTKRELARAFQDILAKYAVDSSQIFIGGFSSGGFGSMVALFSGVVPAKGFVILCPELPADPPDKAIATAVQRGVKGTLLSTSRDRRLGRQREYCANLTQKGLAVRLVTTPDIVHWYPKNLGQLIDEALAHAAR